MENYDVNNEAKQIAGLLDKGQADDAAKLFRDDLREHPESAASLVWQTKVNEKAHVGADIYQTTAAGSAGSILPDFEIGIAQKGKPNIPVAHGEMGSIDVIDKAK